MIPTAVSQVTEGIGRVAFGLFFCGIVLRQGSTALQWFPAGTALTAAASGILEHVNRAFVPSDFRAFADACGALFLSTSVLWLWSRRKGKAK